MDRKTQTLLAPPSASPHRRSFHPQRTSRSVRWSAVVVAFCLTIAGWLHIDRHRVPASEHEAALQQLEASRAETAGAEAQIVLLEQQLADLAARITERRAELSDLRGKTPTEASPEITDYARLYREVLTWLLGYFGGDRAEPETPMTPPT